MSTGKIKVNGNKCPKTYVIKEGDHIEHEMTRNERKVSDRPVEIVYEDEHYVIVNKPSSIPVHPCGAFHYNSLSMILEHEKKYANLLSKSRFLLIRIVGHRLDRQTSGICLFSKTKEAAHRYSESLTQEDIHKVYIARAMGEIKENAFSVNKSRICEWLKRW